MQLISAEDIRSFQSCSGVIHVNQVIHVNHECTARRKQGFMLLSVRLLKWQEK